MAIVKCLLFFFNFIFLCICWRFWVLLGKFFLFYCIYLFIYLFCYYYYSVFIICIFPLRMFPIFFKWKIFNFLFQLLMLSLLYMAKASPWRGVFIFPAYVLTVQLIVNGCCKNFVFDTAFLFIKKKPKELIKFKIYEIST